MKYVCSIIACSIVTIMYGEEPKKRVPFIAHISVNTAQFSSNSTTGQQPPVTYIPQAQPVYQQPQLAQPSAPILQHPATISKDHVQPTVADTYPSSPKDEALSPMSSPSSTPLFPVSSMNELFTALKNTAYSINPITIVAGTVGALYLAYLTKLYFAAYHVTKKNNWSTWKEHIPLEVMQEVPLSEVAEELFAAIKAKYTPLHSADLMTPLVKFNNAVDQEIAHLNHFLQLHDWLNYIKLSYIFPHQEIEITVAQTKIKRLVFLKDVLLAWMSNYSSAIMHDKFIPCFQQQRSITNPVELNITTTES